MIIVPEVTRITFSPFFFKKNISHSTRYSGSDICFFSFYRKFSNFYQPNLQKLNIFTGESCHILPFSLVETDLLLYIR